MAVSLSLLQRFKPFRNLDEKRFQAIESYVRLTEVAKGSFLIKRGKPLKHISFLVTGRVDLVDASFNSESVEGEGARSQLALTEQSPSDVAAQAKTPAQVLQVEHQAFEILANWTDAAAPGTAVVAEQDSGEDWMTSLLDSPLFAQVPPAQLQRLFASFEAIEVGEGDCIIEEGAEGDFFYVIERGAARVITRFDGEVATLGPGQFFGEEALVGDTIRNASVIMRSNGVLMRLNQEDFRALLQEPLLRFVNGEELQQQVARGESVVLIDVRIPVEHRLSRVEDSTNVPLASLRKRLEQLDPASVYVVTDDAGKRSEVAAHLMCQAGFDTYILRNASELYAN